MERAARHVRGAGDAAVRGAGRAASGGAVLNVGGLELETACFGPEPHAAPTLVFLHEGLGSVSHWKDFPARAAEATGCGALVYSRRGYGRSEPAPARWATSFMHDEAALLPKLLGAAGVRKAILVGHSDGASIALIHAATGDARLCGLVLEAPHVFVEEETVRSIAAAVEAYGETRLRRRLRRHHGRNTDALFHAWTGVWLDPEFRRWSIEECLPRVAVPMLVIQGEQDEYGTLAQVEAIRAGAAASVEVLVLEDCGHSPHRDRPEAVLRAIAAFAGRHFGKAA